ncbi:MAG: hypothetical protein NC933_03925 [Candidatus Omnitrophica bacterium]|nr:hypothetical protein [Candidatus Omnitrophota bacterium]
MRRQWYLIMALMVMMAALSGISAKVSAEEEEAAAKVPTYTLDFAGIESKLSSAASEAEALDVINDICSQCRTYDDYEKLSADLKEMSVLPNAANKDVLNYGIGRLRIEQLLCLSKSTEIEAGRLYMSVNDQYYNEALQYLDKVSSTAASKSLRIDAELLKFLVFKEKFQPQKAEAIFNGIVEQIASYSDDAQTNLNELERVCDELIKMDLAKYGTKLKILYAAKTDKATAYTVLDSVKKQADDRFANYDLKNAAELYEQYIAAAPAYLEKDEMAAKILEIAEKYYGAAKYKEARRYYDTYLAGYADSKMADYASYKASICLQQEKDYAAAIDRLQSFVNDYQNSVWFDKAFESLARLYYEKLPRQQAIDRLQSLVDRYYRKNTGDFAQVLIGLLYYRAKDYDIAMEKLKKIESTSMCHYAAQVLIDDINKIKKEKVAPSYGSDIADSYQVWDPDIGIGAAITPTQPGMLGAGGAPINATREKDGSIKISVAPGAKIQLSLTGLVDEDRFNQYMLDKEDISRLPKNLREEKEKDLMSLHWSAEAGNFSDEKESVSKVWQAPKEPGTYKLVVKLDDFGLVRTPDKGLRKDPAKDLNVIVVVGE